MCAHFMKISHCLLSAFSAFCLLLAQPSFAQQDNSWPPPLRRPAAKTTNNAAASAAQPSAPTQPQTEPAKPAVEEPAPTQAAASTQQAPAPTQAVEPKLEVFEDWVHRCSDLIIEEKPFTQCELLQAQQRQQGEDMLNILIMAFAEALPEEGGDKSSQFMLTSVVPLDVFLPEGIRFLVDSRAVMHVPFRNCNASGCWSQVLVEETVLNSLKRGNEGRARFTIINGQEIEVRFSLKGLTAGLAALKPS